MTDLKDFIPESDTLVVTLKDPRSDKPLKNKDGTEMTIEVYTQNSPTGKHAMRDVINTQIKKAKAEKQEELSEEEAFLASFLLSENSTADLLAKTTKGWNITYDGDQPEFSFEVARKVFTEVQFIRAQIDEALQADMDFTKA